MKSTRKCNLYVLSRGRVSVWPQTHTYFPAVNHPPVNRLREIRCGFLYSSWNPCSISDWTAITTDCTDTTCLINHDLETTPLLVRYTADPDLSDKYINLYSASDELLGWIQWERSAAYLSDCGQSTWVVAPQAIAGEQTWQLAKNSTHLELRQQDTVVFLYEMDSSATCSKLKGNTVTKISFNKFAALSASFKPFSGKPLHSCHYYCWGEIKNKLRSQILIQASIAMLPAAFRSFTFRTLKFYPKCETIHQKIVNWFNFHNKWTKVMNKIQ